MANGQHRYVIARAELEIAQGLADQLRFRSHHELGGTELLQRLGACPLVEVGQFDESLGADELLHLVLVGDHKNGVVILEHRLRKRRQKLPFAMLKSLKADENGI